MKRAAMLVLAGAVLVWAGALLDVGGGRKPAPSVAGAAAPPAADEPEKPAPAASRAKAEKPPPPNPPAAPPSAPPPFRPATQLQLRASSAARPLAPDDPSAQATARVARGTFQAVGRMASLLWHTHGSDEPAADQTPAAAPAPRPAGELGEGVLSPEYNELERGYAHEPRTGAWAQAEEQRVRDLLADQDIGGKVAVLSCQSTTCKLVVETESDDAFQRLVNVPGLREATQLDLRSPYSLRSGQLSLYFRPGALSAANAAEAKP